MHAVVNPSATIPMVGASGAIYGVLAAAAMIRPRVIWFVGVFFLSNIWCAFAGSHDGTSFGAHIGGFTAGFLVTCALVAQKEACEHE
jgi:membrane associated rhomboid family serine protease